MPSGNRLEVQKLKNLIELSVILPSELRDNKQPAVLFQAIFYPSVKTMVPIRHRHLVETPTALSRKNTASAHEIPSCYINIKFGK